MKYLKGKVFLIISLLFTLPCAAQEYSMNIQTFSVEDGLTTRYPKTIFQDSEGFIWNINSSGTTSDFNLDRFDGKEFKHFRIEINEPDWNSPVFWSLHQGLDDKIWVYRVFKLDPHKLNLDKRTERTVFLQSMFLTLRPTQRLP